MAPQSSAVTPGVNATADQYNQVRNDTLLGLKVITNVTDAATITFDLSLGNIFTTTLGGNRTLALSNATVGQVFMLELIQDATGSRTVTWFSTISWPYAVVPTLTTTASKKDTFVFRCTGSGTYNGYVVGQSL